MRRNVRWSLVWALVCTVGWAGCRSEGASDDPIIILDDDPAGACSPACESGTECRNGACVPVPADAASVPDARSIPDARRADASTGADGCQPACSDAETCVDGRCVTGLDAGRDVAADTGVVSPVPDATPDTCPPRGCVSPIPDAVVDSSGCSPSCSAGQICRAGRCVVVGRPDTAVDTAYPDVDASLAGSKVTVRHTNLATRRVGPTSAEFLQVSFTLPTGAISFAVAATPVDNRSFPILERLTGPGGVLFSSNAPNTSAVTLLSSNLVRAGLYAAALPNAPTPGFSAGRYTATFSAAGSTTVDVDLLVKTGDLTGQLDRVPVTFWFAPQPYLSAPAARTDADFQWSVNWMKQAYAQRGITLGPFRYRDLSGPNLQALSVVDDDAEMAELLGQIRASTFPGLHFVLIDQFNLFAGGTVLGRSDGIPGVPTHPQTSTTGVVVPLSYMRRYRGLFAGALAHEAGHFFGLFHTSEISGRLHDPLPDTPECAAGQDANGDGRIQPSECTGQGASNLMFWTHGNTPQSGMTPDQADVIRRNPTVR